MKRRARDKRLVTALLLVTPVSIEELEVLILAKASERDQLLARIGLIQKMASRMNVDLMSTPGASEVIHEINSATDIRRISDAWLSLAAMNEEFCDQIYGTLKQKVLAREAAGDTSATGTMMKKLLVGQQVLGRASSSKGTIKAWRGLD